MSCIGIAVGAGIHGYVPTNSMASVMGKGARGGACRCRCVIGVPMYSNAAGIIPIVKALLEKGAALGTVLGIYDGGNWLVSARDDHPAQSVLKPRLIATYSSAWSHVGYPNRWLLCLTR